MFKRKKTNILSRKRLKKKSWFLQQLFYLQHKLTLIPKSWKYISRIEHIQEFCWIPYSIQSILFNESHFSNIAKDMAKHNQLPCSKHFTSNTCHWQAFSYLFDLLSKQTQFTMKSKHQNKINPWNTIHLQILTSKLPQIPLTLFISQNITIPN